MFHVRYSLFLVVCYVSEVASRFLRVSYCLALFGVCCLLVVDSCQFVVCCVLLVVCGVWCVVCVVS